MGWRNLMEGAERFMDDFDRGRDDREYDRKGGRDYEKGYQEGYEDAMREMSGYGERERGGYDGDGYGERRGVKGTGRYSRYRR